MKNTQKGFVIPLVVIIVLALIGGGAYMYTKQDKKPSSTVSQVEEMDAEPAVAEKQNPEKISPQVIDTLISGNSYDPGNRDPEYLTVIRHDQQNTYRRPPIFL
jgi:hypothetical protein